MNDWVFFNEKLNNLLKSPTYRQLNELTHRLTDRLTTGCPLDYFIKSMTKIVITSSFWDRFLIFTETLIFWISLRKINAIIIVRDLNQNIANI